MATNKDKETGAVNTGTNPPRARDMKKKRVRTPILQEQDKPARDSGKQGSTGGEGSTVDYTSRYPAEGSRDDSFHNEGEREYDKDPELPGSSPQGERSPRGQEGSRRRQNEQEDEYWSGSPAYGSYEQGPNRNYNRYFEYYERGYRDGSRHASLWYNQRDFERRNLREGGYNEPTFQGGAGVNSYAGQFENRPGYGYHPEYLEQYPEFRGRGSYRRGEEAGEYRDGMAGRYSGNLYD